MQPSCRDEAQSLEYTLLLPPLTGEIQGATAPIQVAGAMVTPSTKPSALDTSPVPFGPVEGMSSADNSKMFGLIFQERFPYF